LTNFLRGPDEKGLRTGFGPRGVVWRPLQLAICRFSKQDTSLQLSINTAIFKKKEAFPWSSTKPQIMTLF